MVRMGIVEQQGEEMISFTSCRQLISRQMRQESRSSVMRSKSICLLRFLTVKGHSMSAEMRMTRCVLRETLKSLAAQFPSDSSAMLALNCPKLK